MSLSRVDHVGQLNQSSISELEGMVAGLRGVLGSSCNEDPSIIGLNGTKSDGNVKVNVENLSLFPLMVHIVKSNDLLVKLKEVNLVCHNRLDFLLLLPIDHADASLRKVVCHRQLGVPVETNILLAVHISLVLTQLRVSRLGSISSTVTRSEILTLGYVLVIEHLLEQKFMDFNIAIVHHEIFRHKVLESLSINDVKLAVALEAVDHGIDALLKLIPVLFVLLDFALSPR